MQVHPDRKKQNRRRTRTHKNTGTKNAEIRPGRDVPMTSRRGTLIEEGARELLQLNGYTVRVIPPGFHKSLPPAHLTATCPGGVTRFIRIRKISRLPSTVETVRMKCTYDLVRLRKYLSGHAGAAGISCEIWLYSLTCGFRCFLVLADSIREIPRLPVDHPSSSKGRDVP